MEQQLRRANDNGAIVGGGRISCTFYQRPSSGSVLLRQASGYIVVFKSTGPARHSKLSLPRWYTRVVS